MTGPQTDPGGGPTTDRAHRRRAEVIHRLGEELLRIPGHDGSRIRQAGWAALGELVGQTPGLRVVRLVRTGDGFGAGLWLGTFGCTPLVLPVGPATPADSPQVRALLDAAAGTGCTWLMIDPPPLVPEVTMAVGRPGGLEADLVLTVRSLLNLTMLAYRTSLLHDDLHEQAVTDALTHLANRQAFTEVLDDVLGHPGAGDAALLLVDLDGFTVVNDTCGHAAGDRLLVRVADVLREIVRSSDVVARVGGDEFAVLLPGIDESAAARIAERIVFAVSTLGADDTGTVATGAGVGVVGVRAGLDLQTLLLRADLALRAAKDRGRGQVEIWAQGGG